MKKRALPLVFMAFAVPILFAGCSGSLHFQGVKALNADRAEEATELLRIALAEHPDDALIMRDLGLACYETSDFACAIDRLSAADERGAAGGRALCALGAAYEAVHQEQLAYAVYARYPEIGYFSDDRRKMARRTRELTDRIVVRAEGSEKSLAVLPLKMRTDSERLRPMGTGLSEWMMTDLYRVRDLDVVERIRINEVLRELRVADDDRFDPASAPRLGKILGARRIVSGSILDLGDERMRIELYAIDLETADDDIALSEEGKLTEFFAIEKSLVFALVDALGIELTPRERAEIERVPTKSLSAFLAYAQGLEEEDRGRYPQADLHFREVSTFDPDAVEVGAFAAADAVEPPPDLAVETETIDALIDNVSGDSWEADISSSPPDIPEVREQIPDPPEPPATPTGKGGPVR